MRRVEVNIHQAHGGFRRQGEGRVNYDIVELNTNRRCIRFCVDVKESPGWNPRISFESMVMKEPSTDKAGVCYDRCDNRMPLRGGSISEPGDTRSNRIGGCLQC